MKKLVCCLICITLLFSVFSAQISAEEFSGSLDAKYSLSSNNSILTVKVYLNNPGVIAIKFNAQYDKGVLALKEYNAGNLLPVYMPPENISDIPFITIMGSPTGRANITKSGELITLKFSVQNRKALSGTKISFSVPDAVRFDLQEKASVAKSDIVIKSGEALSESQLNSYTPAFNNTVSDTYNKSSTPSASNNSTESYNGDTANNSSDNSKNATVSQYAASTISPFKKAESIRDSESESESENKKQAFKLLAFGVIVVVISAAVTLIAVKRRRK